MIAILKDTEQETWNRYILRDNLSDMTDSLSRATQQYSLSSEWIKCDPEDRIRIKIACRNLVFCRRFRFFLKIHKQPVLVFSK